MDDDLKALWTNQPEEIETMAIEDIRKRAGGLQSVARTRNIIEYAAGLLVIAAFGGVALIMPEPLMKLGAGLIAAGSVFVMANLHLRASAKSVPGGEAAQPIRDFHRREIIRQRDALKSAWLWYVMPLVPGLAVLYWGMAEVTSYTSPSLLGAIAVSIVVLVGIGWLNRVAARKLDQDLKDIDG